MYRGQGLGLMLKQSQVCREPGCPCSASSLAVVLIAMQTNSHDRRHHEQQHPGKHHHWKVKLHLLHCIHSTLAVPKSSLLIFIDYHRVIVVSVLLLLPDQHEHHGLRAFKAT